jgi:hypothetical protein
MLLLGQRINKNIGESKELNYEWGNPVQFLRYPA